MERHIKFWWTPDSYKIQAFSHTQKPSIMLASACQRCIVIYTEISVCRIGYNILCHREADRISLLKTGISQNNLTRNINQIRLLVRPSHISFIDFGIEFWKWQRHSKMLFSSVVSALKQIWLESYRWTIIGNSPKYTATQTINATTQKRDAHEIHACRKIISTQVKFGAQQHAKGNQAQKEIPELKGRKTQSLRDWHWGVHSTQCRDIKTQEFIS